MVERPGRCVTNGIEYNQLIGSEDDVSKETKRDWTQHDIVEDTRRQHSGPGFFNVLGGVCEEAFGGTLDYDLGRWQFPMGDLTIGQLLDFFVERNAKPCLDWHNEFGGPCALRADP
jgi:hypothetical protein